MHFSTFLAAGAATLAAAAPVVDPASSLRCLDSPDLQCNNNNIRSNPTDDLTPGAFNITNFIYGCTSGCYWYFNVSVEGTYANHPAAPTPVYLQGGLDENTDYVRGNVSGTQQISAYIVKETNTLKLEYEVSYPDLGPSGAVYRYYGEQVVYAATSVNASLQEPNFKVNETRFTGVA
ncbi:hypothetical protein Slin15195_G104470 [Septoria linicola]|uniref:Uncharacterized protein n=1 Tax=Septoria linicola TaxID=215465 RepID=A0A9Q9B1E0_9PEZI|nr:hypothetical protein Slin14017_G067510 [Septoria linicola]USW57128.1 hypothetical protein Slin15195_G104470 [Septoria linicola]